MSLNTLLDYTPENIINDKCAVEAGYVNDPNDSGGETNHGCTAALVNQYKAQLQALFHWDGTMVNLSLEMARWLYKTHFWDKMNLDAVMHVSPLLADKLFDIGINTGKTNAVTMLQVHLNLLNFHGKYWPDMPTDGSMGPTTLKALDAYVGKRGALGQQRLLVAMLCSQGAYYRDLVARREKDEDFYYGWLGRVTRDMGHYAKLLGIDV